MTTTQEPQYKPGDRCRMIGNFRVEHADDCDEYVGGTITNVITGKVVTK